MPGLHSDSNDRIMITINGEKWTVVTPWHNEAQKDGFLRAWGYPKRGLLMLQDKDGIGCGAMKNLCVDAALAEGATGVIVLDDDCFPLPEGHLPVKDPLYDLIRRHVEALEPQEVEMVMEVTSPISRGTPYFNRTVRMPVAASMGFWTGIGDYDAPAQLVRGATTPMEFVRKPVFGKYFACCGMNLAFRPKEWLPWCRFIDVPRMDDIWMGWLWEKEAYVRGFCFNLGGPLIRHSRQSNVWANLRDESKYLEANETLWSDVATHPSREYSVLRGLLPV